MRCAVVLDGLVVNVAECNEQDILSFNEQSQEKSETWITSESASVGDIYNHNTGIFSKLEIPLTADQVNYERDRRLLSIQFNGIMFQTRMKDILRLNGAFSKSLAVLQGIGTWDEDFVWIASDDTKISMSMVDVIEFGQAVAKNEEAHVMAGNALKTMPNIPQDYTDNKWWPNGSYTSTAYRNAAKSEDVEAS